MQAPGQRHDAAHRVEQGEGIGALAFYAPGGSFVGTVVTGASEAAYPVGNFFPPTLTDVGFVNFLIGGDYALGG